MKTARKKESITRSKCTSIPKPFSPIPVMYKNKTDGRLVWDVLGDGALAASLGESWEEVAPKLPGESEKYTVRYAIIGGKTTIASMYGWKAPKPEPTTLNGSMCAR